MEILILDNASTDNTIEIIKKELPAIRHSLFASNSNVGFWAGVEKLLPNAKGEYVIACTDAIMDPHFIERSIEVMEQDKSIGALQAKIYQIQKAVGSEQKAVIDTCGFKIEKSRRVTNLGHGEEDHGQYDAQREIFAVEGAVPVFRRSALEDCKMKELPTAHCPLPSSWLVDPDFRVGSFGYGDDLDVAWRMRLFGWKQILAPNVIAYHDRSTTKGLAKTVFASLHRRALRSRIDIRKRRLDWSNVRFTIIKNDYIINLCKDLPYILVRELMVLGYTVLFEPAALLEAFRFFNLLPTMLRRRHQVMQKAKTSPQDMRKWFL